MRTQNVSGRLLVGLRWWNNVKDDGSNDWVFESLEDMSEVGPMDSRVFWWALYGTPVLWSVKATNAISSSYRLNCAGRVS